MKKYVLIPIAACLILAVSGTAFAVDVKVSGQWYFHYGYYSNNSLTKNSETGHHSDRSLARQRVRTQVEFIADETLSALLNLEANMNWGSTEEGINGGHGGLDADQAGFVIRRAYLDWTIPTTRIKTRMGMQGIYLPAAVAGNPVLEAEVAGVTVSTPLTEEMGLTVFWARPYDNGFQNDVQTDGKNFYDDMDMFGVSVPITTDSVKINPWAMFALIGKDSEYFGDRGIASAAGGSGKNRGRALINPDRANDQIYAWWAGTSFELPVIDPFLLRADGFLGGIETGDSDSNAFGYFLAGEFGYKFSFATLTARGWYSSGDKDEDDRGIIPIVSDDETGFHLTRYGLAGNVNRSWDRLISGNGLGMWGVGLQLAGVTFVEDLQHTVGAYYMSGTNKADSSPRRSLREYSDANRFGDEFLMSSDKAWEIDFLNTYKVNDNLSVSLDFAYVWLDLGDSWVDRNDTKGSFATMVGVQYSF